MHTLHVVLAIGVIACVLAEPAFSQNFRPEVVHPTAQWPKQVAAGDFDGDGRADLAVTHTWMPGVRVFWSNGAGFDVPVDYPVPPFPDGGGAAYPSFVVPGDFDNDGALDIGYCARDAGTSRWQAGALHSRGKTLAAGPYFPTRPDYPAAMAAADIDGNGLLDLAVAGKHGSTGLVSVHYWQPDGTAVRRDYSVGDQAYGIGVADLNQDGFKDVAVGTDDYYYADQPVRILYGQSGGLSPYVPYGGPYHVLDLAVGDLNGDGIPDIAMGGYTGAEVLTILYNRGTGGFARRDYTLASRAYRIAIADFDLDGRPDLAMSHPGSASITVLYGQPDGSLDSPESYPVQDDWGQLAAGDFNGDGGMDLAVGHMDEASISILYNTIPEPATLALLGIGAIGLIRRRRRGAAADGVHTLKREGSEDSSGSRSRAHVVARCGECPPSPRLRRAG